MNKSPQNKWNLNLIATLLLLLASGANAQSLNDAEKKTLASWDRQVRAFQPVARKHLTGELSRLTREARAVSRDRDLADSERERKLAELREEIEIVRGMIDDMRSGELKLMPEINFARIKVGDMGVISVGDTDMHGNYLVRGYGKVWNARQASDKAMLCFVRTLTEQGKPSMEDPGGVVFEVVKRTEEDGSGRAWFTLRALDIASLQERQEASSPE